MKPQTEPNAEHLFFSSFFLLISLSSVCMCVLYSRLPKHCPQVELANTLWSGESMAEIKYIIHLSRSSVSRSARVCVWFEIRIMNWVNNNFVTLYGAGTTATDEGEVEMVNGHAEDGLDSWMKGGNPQRHYVTSETNRMHHKQVDLCIFISLTQSTFMHHFVLRCSTCRHPHSHCFALIFHVQSNAFAIAGFVRVQLFTMRHNYYYYHSFITQHNNNGCTYCAHSTHCMRFHWRSFSHRTVFVCFHVACQCALSFGFF